MRANRIQPDAPSGSKRTLPARHAVSMGVLVASLAALSMVALETYDIRVPGLTGRTGSSGALRSGAPGAAGEGENTEPAATPITGRYHALAEFLAKKYRVSREFTVDLVSIAHAVGTRLGLDPLLILAVMAVESKLNPIAESVAGAKGLMQVIPKYHSEKLDGFGGEQAVFDPEANIVVGALILKEYLRRTGNLTSALQMYAGALDDHEDEYSARVLYEKQRLQDVLARYVGRARQSKSPASSDTVLGL